MYTLTFNENTIKDLVQHQADGRQLYGAIIVPYSGLFTSKNYGSEVQIPKIVCPYQVNDIIAIQEKWARKENGYVYKDYSSNAETLNAGYNFRPAPTMPVNAARMFARIVSIRTWSATPEIVKNYLSMGVSADSYAGTAKVIDYYDNGNKLLSTIRKARNKEVLAKSYQQFVASNPPMRENYAVTYMLNAPYAPAFHHQVPGGATLNRIGPKTRYAPAYDDSKYDVLDEEGHVIERRNVLKDGSLIDTNYNKWYRIGCTSEDMDKRSDSVYFLYLGQAGWYSEADPTNIYLRYDKPSTQADAKLIPVYATYNTTIVDPSKHLFAWLISAYLCTKDGEIIGNWF